MVAPCDYLNPSRKARPALISKPYPTCPRSCAPWRRQNRGTGRETPEVFDDIFSRIYGGRCVFRVAEYHQSGLMSHLRSPLILLLVAFVIDIKVRIIWFSLEPVLNCLFHLLTSHAGLKCRPALARKYPWGSCIASIRSLPFARFVIASGHAYGGYTLIQK